MLGFVTNDTYVYDDVNRLTSVNAVNYSWDNNGNLLNDGVNTHTYDTANRLKTLSGGGSNVTYAYNGLGDRLRETVNGNPTTFTMDLNMGLTQALSESAPQGYGTKAYIYGNGRIAQAAGTSTEYFLGDALGSVRQMTNAGSTITYAKAHDPYGVVASTAGSSQSAYGYTGEFTSNNLVYLRARQYAPSTGRFLTRDTWMGDYNRPLSLNRWMYTEGNPVNFTDPSGYITEKEAKRAELILGKLDSIYDVQIEKDWGYLNEFIYYPNMYIDSSNTLVNCYWVEGNWRSLHELELVLEAVKDMTKAFGGKKGLFNTAMRWRPLRVYRIPMEMLTIGDDSYVAFGFDYVILFNYPFDRTDERAKAYIVHEFAHVIDFRQGWPPGRLGNGMVAETKSFSEVCINGPRGQLCKWVYDPTGQIEPPPSPRAQYNPQEDWAESLMYFVYPSFGSLGPKRKDYIERAIKNNWVP